MPLITDFDRVISSETAKQDHIELKLMGARVSRGDADEFFRHLTPAARQFSSFIRDNPFFGDLNRDAYPRYTTSIISGNTPGSGQRRAPLLTGTLRGAAIAAGAYQLTIKLELNPTRFARYQRRIFVGGRLPQGWTENLSLWATRSRNRYRGEFPLQADSELVDNVLLGPHQEQFGTPENWPRLRNTYLASVNTLLVQTLQNAARHASCHLDLPNSYQIEKAETYWELPSSPSSDELAQIARIFPMVARECRVAMYPSSTEWHGNSLVLTLRLSNARKLKIYAKTNERIRVEVIHDLKENTTALRGMYQGRGGPFETLSDRLTILARDASAVSRAVLTTIARHIEQPIAGVPWYLFIARFSELHAREISPEVRTQILSLLVHRGSVLASKRSNLRDAVEVLRKHKILEHRPHEPGFTVTEQYRFALAQLQSLRDDPRISPIIPLAALPD